MSDVLETDHLEDLGAAPDPYVGKTLGERYRVIRLLGGGGMGAVYEAEHKLIGRRVAVKLLHAHFASNRDIIKRFLNEARAAAMLGHPHILECTDMGQAADGAPFLVLELLEGRDLGREIREGGQMSIGRAVRIARQIASALSAAHARGIIHRDLKPENVFLTKKGEEEDFVKVLDFGISKFTSTVVTGPGTHNGAMGTPQYMAPEQARDASAVDHRADIYALGAILYESLTGEMPFDGPEPHHVFVKIWTEEPTPIAELRRDVPGELTALVERAMAKNPDERPGSMEELSETLAPFESLMSKSPDLQEFGFLSTLPTPTPADREDPLHPPAFGVGASRQAAKARAEQIPSEDFLGGSSEAAGSMNVDAAAPASTPVDHAVPPSSLRERVPSRPAWPWVAAGVAAAAVTLSGYVLFAERGNEPTPAVPPAPSTSDEPTADRVSEPALPLGVEPPSAMQPPAAVPLTVASPDRGAELTFRGETGPLPYAGMVAPGGTPELLEVHAQGRRGLRLWLTVDEARSLWVDLERGHGVTDASDAQLEAALRGPTGRAAAPDDTSHRPRSRPTVDTRPEPTPVQGITPDTEGSPPEAPTDEAAARGEPSRRAAATPRASRHSPPPPATTPRESPQQTETQPSSARGRTGSGDVYGGPSGTIPDSI